MAMKIVEIELSGPLPATIPLAGTAGLFILWRWRGRPVGQTHFRPATALAEVPATTLRELAAADLGLAWGEAYWGEKLALTLTLSQRERGSDGSQFSSPLPKGEGSGVRANGARQDTITIIICTRDRPDDLRRCLEALCPPAAAAGAEIVIVDNAPSDDRTRQLTAGYPVRYVLEPRPGLNWARHAGAKAATGDLLLYTDDDVVIDPQWIVELSRPFANPNVGAVTGLVMPLELETEAQELFERYGGFGRGFRERDFSAYMMPPAAGGKVGAGASMAVRRRLALGYRLFANEFDGGTVTKSGGDTYAFYRLLALGERIVYTPAALVWHRHRRTLAELRGQLYGYSVGVYAMLWRAWREHGDWQGLVIGGEWFFHHHLRQLVRGLLRRPNTFPLEMTWAEWRGFAASWGAYRQMCRQEAGYRHQGDDR